MPFEVRAAPPTLADLDDLFVWLLATGEYDDEAQQLESWREWLGRTGGEAALAGLVRFAEAFEGWANERLGRYTAGVGRFLRTELPRRRWREDAVQCARRPSEYHLSMVGADILNRAWRRDFLARRRHVVVLPGCLRALPEDTCAAEQRDHHFRCAGCASGCPLHVATRRAETAGTEAIAVLHGSDFGAHLRAQTLAGGDVGIVGGACAPGLLGAGWRARGAGLPAQCVLLDASGCRHWLERPVATSFDLGELERILDVAAGRCELPP
jgi:hypothetical protein